MLTKLDKYIIKKFIGTYVYAIILIISITIIFDISEKMDDFLNGPSLYEIIFDYYLNFIPYFSNLFSHLFIFITVIFFTSKMAGDSEIIAILSSGVSYKRFLRPYIISAFILALFSFILGSFIIPKANIRRVKFEETYISKNRNYQQHIHKQVTPGLYFYMRRYDVESKTGRQFSLEKFKNGNLVSKMMAESITWDTTKNKWSVRNYFIRDIDGLNEKMRSGKKLDTTISIQPEEFSRTDYLVQKMDLIELNKYVESQIKRGSENTLTYIIERYKRFADPFATFVLTLIGVALASRKVRGGIGVHLGVGIALSFIYILFMQISTTFATGSNLNPFIAVWIPNILFLGIAAGLISKAQK